MGILDNVPSDPNPLVVTIDFSQFVDGAKLSSAARSYFAASGQTEISFYFAHILFEKMKERMMSDASKNIMQDAISQVQTTQEAIDLAELKKV